MDAEGGNLRRIDFTTLCTSAPAVMPDGAILCTRWEYQDKNIFSWQGLWTLLPDGRQLQLYYGNTLTVPNSRYGGKPVPGSDQIMITLAAHHHPPIGDVAFVDHRAGIENPQAIRKATFETSYQPTQGRTWLETNWHPGDKIFPYAVCDPCPLSTNLFLASFGDRATGNEAFTLCVARDTGERYPLSELGSGIFSAVSLTPRPLPSTVVRTQVPTEAGEGVFYVQDVYRGLAEQGVKRGQVKRLRVMRQLPKKWNTEGKRVQDHYPVIGYGSYYVKENLGEAPVDENGEAYFRVPSNCEIYFIALDEAGREIRRMGSVTQITTGERVSCVGCHEDRASAPPSDGARRRLAGEPDALAPLPGGAGPVDYVRQVQPVWDRHCTRCHGGTDPAAGIDLTGGRTRFFSLSYENLVGQRKMVESYYINRGPTGVFPALSSGSWVSPLTALIEKKHHGAALARDERRTVYAWIDANAPYYATWDMSRPHTQGGRDPCHTLAPGTRRVVAEPWFTRLSASVAENCVGCHGSAGGSLDDDDPDSTGWLDSATSAAWGGRASRWFNLDDPEKSAMLTVHLAKAAGGRGRPARKKDAFFAGFATVDDPVYRDLLAVLCEGRAALAAKPRMDMPGGVAVPQERDFGRVF